MRGRSVCFWSGGALAVYTLYSSERHSRDSSSFEASKLLQPGNTSHTLLHNLKEKGNTNPTLLHNLKEKGVCLLSGAVTAEDLDKCQELKSFRDSAAAKTSRNLLLKSHFWESTGGRFHVNQDGLLRHFPSDIDLLTRLEAAWLPLVEEYLPVKEDGVKPHLSDLQLLVSLPQSSDQFFHQDNRRQGLTVAVPLVEVTPEIGPTQLLPGTHNITHGRGEVGKIVDCALLSVLKDGDAAVRACVAAGSAVIYDSRTLHRGLANNHQAKSRPMLVYRYDYPDTPQPGHSITSTLLFRAIGIFICALQELRTYFSQ